MTGTVLNITDLPQPVVYRVPPLITLGIAVMFFYLVCLAYQSSKSYVTASQKV